MDIISLPRKFIDFVKESYAELKKVSWLSREDVIKATMGVIMIVIFFAIYLGIVDFIVVRLVKAIIGG